MPKFLQFIERYRDRLVHHAFYRTGDLEEAEDIVQDVFVKENTEPKLDKNLKEKTPEEIARILFESFGKKDWKTEVQFGVAKG